MPTTTMTLTASIPASVNLGGGVTAVNAETFNGAIPGPTISLTVGDTLIVRLINNMPHPVGIHWHGIELENYSDGTEVTQNEVPGAPLQILGNGVPAGGTFLYKFNVPKAGIFWYHPHHYHSTNRTFRGLYGMIIVKDADEITLEGNGTLPTVPLWQQLVLSDITVCKTLGFNDALTYVDPSTVSPATNASEWLSSVNFQNGPTPTDLCDTNTVDEMGMPMMITYGLGDIPNTFRMNPISTGVPPVVEGQMVLTNGMNVGHRHGTPALPAGFPGPITSIPAQPGQGLRFRIVNAATTRYFRLRLTDTNGNQINLVRVGGEGGILNAAVVEGGIISGFNTKYSTGEILLGPGSRADVVAVIPLGTSAGVCTMWTRDYQRVGPVNPGNWSQIPTVPVLHILVSGPNLPLFPMVNGTPLKSTLTPTAALGAATGTLLNPAAFSPVKPGMSNQTIQLTASGGSNGIDSVVGNFDGFFPYTTVPHIGSTRYANSGDILQLSIMNVTGAHHPFHLHGFSFQPLFLALNSTPTVPVFNFPVEFRDNLDIPNGHTLVFRVHLSPRPLANPLTAGGAFGRWLFHCHIFFHAHHGMISELVVTDSSGREKPNVNVNGSWTYAPFGGIATRTGTWSHPDGTSTSLSASYGTVIQNMGGTWSWSSPVGAPVQTTYVYIEALDIFGKRDQAVFRLKIGAPDDGSDIGDPHIHTVDGNYYDFQAVGEFILLRDHDGLEVQARQKPVLTANPIRDNYTGITACVSLNVAVAARVGTHHISYQPIAREPGVLQFYIDGEPETLTTQGIYLDGHHVSGFLVNGQMALRVDYSHHAVLIATPLFWSTHNMWYLNISVARTHADEGVMGAIPSGTWLPLLATGASLGAMPASISDRYNALYGTFANSWRVTDLSSLFHYEAGESTATFTDTEWPAGQPPCNLRPDFAIPGAPLPQGMPISQATQVCQFITDAGLNRDCIFDMATIGDEEFAGGYDILQNIRRRSTAIQLVSLRRGEVTAIVLFMIESMLRPAGMVTFYVNEQRVAEAQLDADGMAVWPTGSLSEGRVTAAYTPFDGEDADPSTSPEFELTGA